MIVRNSDAEVLELTCPPQWSSASMEQLTVWVDPLDGTKEYTQVRAYRLIYMRFNRGLLSNIHREHV